MRWIRDRTPAGQGPTSQGDQSFFRVPQGKHRGVSIEQLFFKDLHRACDEWDRATLVNNVHELENLKNAATTGRVVLACRGRCGRATIASIPWGPDGHSVNGAMLICGGCDPRYEGYSKVELSLEGALLFCQLEPRAVERRRFGRLLARAYGLGQVTERKALEFFHGR